MTGFLEDSALRMAGLNDVDIANLNAVLPAIQNLISVVQAHQHQFNTVMAVVLPIAQKIIAKERELK